MRLSDYEHNRLQALRRLRALEPIARTDLARLAGLTGGTITSIIGDLVSRGLVVEEKVSSSGRGRPRLNLRMNSSGAYAAGATLRDDARLQVDIVDLKGQSIFAHVEKLDTRIALRDFATHLADVIAGAISRSPIDKRQVAHVGIGLPAVVDSRTGVVEFFETFDDVPFPFAATVQDRLNIPTALDNAVNLLARGEHWFGAHEEPDDFTIVLVDLGIVASQYRGGQLVRGAHGLAAEFGHVKIVPQDGRHCHCGARGCLQTYSSISGIVGQHLEAQGRSIPHHSLLMGEFDKILALADRGDPDTQQLIDRAATYLGVAIANHINVQDPRNIILLSSDQRLLDRLSGAMSDAVRDNTLKTLYTRTTISTRRLDDRDYSRGAAAMVLETLYTRSS